jgi:hypothetical protein
LTSNSIFSLFRKKFEEDLKKKQAAEEVAKRKAALEAEKVSYLKKIINIKKINRPKFIDVLEKS